MTQTLRETSSLDVGCYRAYAGAIGYIAAGGKRMDLAITIRTCVIANGSASVQAGAGIVADSVAEHEYAETVNKARAMFHAIEMAEKGL